MLCSTSVELRHHCELTKKTLISTAYKFLYHKKFRSGFLSSHQKRVSLFALPGHCSLRVSVLTIVFKSKVYARQGWPRPEVAQRLPAYLKSSKLIFFFFYLPQPILKFSSRRLGWTAKILNSTQWTFGTGSENRALVPRGHVLRSSWEVHIVNCWQVKRH